jgi:hypothetical protein
VRIAMARMQSRIGMPRMPNPNHKNWHGRPLPEDNRPCVRHAPVACAGLLCDNFVIALGQRQA